MNIQMAAVYLGLLGLIIFLLALVILGAWLRKNPTKENAEKSSRVMHFLFFTGLGIPIVFAFFYPGFHHLDSLVGYKLLPFQPIFMAVGILFALPGLYLMGASNRTLRSLGSGANAFRLTRRIVAGDVYRYTRNPMSLGYYLIGLSLGFISGSSLLTLYIVLGIIPAHLFYLKYFEEYELALRFGDTYSQYKRMVPFLFPRMPAKVTHTTIQP